MDQEPMNAKPFTPAEEKVEIPASSGLDQARGTANVVDLNHESVDRKYFKIGTDVDGDDGPSAALIPGGRKATRSPSRSNPFSPCVAA
jgi:hypothetical protein